jgi:hypothetical protein
MSSPKLDKRGHEERADDDADPEAGVLVKLVQLLLQYVYEAFHLALL